MIENEPSLGLSIKPLLRISIFTFWIIDREGKSVKAVHLEGSSGCVNLGTDSQQEVAFDVVMRSTLRENSSFDSRYFL